MVKPKSNLDYGKIPEYHSAPSKLMIRTGLFHSIKGVSKNGVSALEFETPMDKKILSDLKMTMEEDQSLMREKIFQKT